MNSPSYNTPILSNNDNNNLPSRLHDSESSTIRTLRNRIDEKRAEEELDQENDQQGNLTSPITNQPKSTIKPVNESADRIDILYQAALMSLTSPTSTMTTPIDATENILNTITMNSTSAATPSNNKSNPKRTMILSGRPAPALPPRPVFPAELENYQLQSGSFESNEHMQSYLARVREDFEEQTRQFEILKELLLEDTEHMTAVVAELDAMDEDPFTLDSFENLMRIHASKGKDFIIARVTTQDSHENKHYHSYYSAHQINKVLFRTQPEEGLLHRMKARNPLNNMLIVGDVHYYSISAADVNAITPLPTVHSPSASISSHSSRMSRCSKLAAQAIASQSTSARSSPILGSDMSLFSRSSDFESPVSSISSVMALSTHKADQECPLQGSTGGNITSLMLVEHSVVPPLRPRRHQSHGASGSSTNSTPTSIQGAFQPGRPSRLRQAIDTDDRVINTKNTATMPIHLTNTVTNRGPSFTDEASDGSLSPMTPPLTQQHPRNPQNSPISTGGQSPLFQSLMGGRIRSRSSTASSVCSDRSSTSTTSSRSYQSHASKCTTVTADKSDCYSPTSEKEGKIVANITQEKEATVGKSNKSGSDDVVYKFRYLASDDDFLLRSTVRQKFKINALESWDAILFTISNNALREYSNQGGEQVLEPLGGHHHPLPHPPESPSSTTEVLSYQQQQPPLSLPIPTATASAVAAQYSASQPQVQSQEITPAPSTIQPQNISLPDLSSTEYYHRSGALSSNHIVSTPSFFDSEDSARTSSTLSQQRAGYIYSAGTNSPSSEFDTHNQEINSEQVPSRLARSMSQSHNNRQMKLFRSLPTLPLGTNESSDNYAEGSGSGETPSSSSGSLHSNNGGHKKLRRVLSKIFSRKYS
ncbi:hypothetical protein FBU30_001005 [Linnemannia zychae]|nr:hypothetical protein FBU30_001005 [Linnemannia zychae]